MAQRRKELRIVDILEWDKKDGGRGLVRKLQLFGAIPDSKECSNCWQQMTVQKDGRGGFKWRCNKKDPLSGKKCLFGISLLAGTLFENRKLPMRVICCAILMFVNGLPLARLSKVTGKILSKATLLNLYKFFRAICFNGMISNLEPIGGRGCTVEIDKSKFKYSKYSKKNFRGHPAKYMFLRECKEQSLSPFEEFLKMAGCTVFPLSQELLYELYVVPIEKNAVTLPTSGTDSDSDAEEDEDISDSEEEDKLNSALGSPV